MTGPDFQNYSMSKADRKRREHISAAVERCVGFGGKSNYDSVVIAGGNGVGTYAFVSRLARSPEFAGKIVLAGTRVAETRQLKGGVSLRGATADYLSYSLAVPQEELVDHATGGSRPRATTTKLTINMASKDSSGLWRSSRNGPWIGGNSGLNRPLLYGARNSRVANSIRELSQLEAVQELDTEIESLEHARSLAPGKNPLVVNSTTNGTLLGNVATKPIGGTIGVQMAFKAAPGGLIAPMQSGTTMTPLARRDGAIDVGIYQPFADPLSPEASFYGLFIRPIGTGKIDTDAEYAILEDEVVGLGETYGLVPVDLEETVWRAKAPAASYDPLPPSAPGTLELRRACSMGFAGYYADGMAGAAVGGLMAAESILRGVEPYPAIRQGLRKWRLYNKLWWYQTTRMAAVVDLGLRINPRIPMIYPHTWSKNEWASHA